MPSCWLSAEELKDQIMRMENLTEEGWGPWCDDNGYNPNPHDSYQYLVSWLAREMDASRDEYLETRGDEMRDDGGGIY